MCVCVHIYIYIYIVLNQYCLIVILNPLAFIVLRILKDSIISSYSINIINENSRTLGPTNFRLHLASFSKICMSKVIEKIIRSILKVGKPDIYLGNSMSQTNNIL